MAKNILLMFLSDAKTDKLGDKVTIIDTHYENVDGEDTKTTNESAVRYILQKNSLDKIFIFASEKVRQEIVHRDGSKYLGEDGKPQTHLEFFLERVKKFIPNVEAEVFPYDEKISGDENLKSVAKTAGLIQKFVSDCNGEEVVLHVDLTGGMRHINIMMLDLTRLLEYSGLKIGHLLYSNYNKKIVEELKNIYDLFQLIAGVEEFVNFGSVKALKNYYADKKISVPLKKLLDAMEDFAEAIKLCHYGQFSSAIIKLHNSVRDFSPAENDTQDILMARLIDRIREDYHNLIVGRELDDLRVIRWCLNKGYLQQALTLCTERIPEYLAEKKLVTQRKDEFRKMREARGDDVRPPAFYLLNVYKSDDKKFNSLGVTVSKELAKVFNDYYKLIKTIPDALKKNLTYDEWHAQLDKLIEKTCTKIKSVCNAPLEKEHIVCEDEKKLRAQFELLASVKANPQMTEDLSNAELEPLKEFFLKLKPQLDGQPDSKRRKIIFNSFAQIPNDELKKIVPKLVCRRNTQIFRLKMMLDEPAQIFSVAFDEKIFFDVMEKYFRIKIERNRSAHANESNDTGEFPTAESLRDFMRETINELEGVTKNSAQ